MNFFDKLKSVLQADNRFFDSEGNLLRNKLFEASNKMDKSLLHLLLSSHEVKEKLFCDVDGTLVFDSRQFNFIINNREFCKNSYTSYKNKIGLADKNNDLINAKNDVVLVFPYKDGVLSGGQTKDDEKREEIFYNKTLASNEIDVLLKHKVLCNFELFNKTLLQDENDDATKEEEIQDFITASKEKEQTVSDFDTLEQALENKANLLIKGNNLIALYSLKEYFRQKEQEDKVKLIYIDPPYNTGNDSFNYNDRFNHSTYLCFMKNRLEIARELLRDDGVIFVQCDDNEQAYLKVLMDEIFGRENFVSCLVWANKEGGGKSDSKFFRNKHEYILCFAKNKTLLTIYGQEIENVERYTLSDEYEAIRGKHYLQKLGMGTIQYSQSLDYPIKVPDGTFITPKENNGDKKACWRWGKDKLEWGLQNGFVVMKKNKDNIWTIYTKQYLNCDNEGNIKPRSIQPLAMIEKHSNTQSQKHLKAVNIDFSYSKPEGLIMDILKFATNENDLVLDFFAGSGTTLAVAHKMKRKYIGIEQMDYIESITKERLKKVIDGESGGISKAVEWQGGGNLVYCELAKQNQKYVDLIEKATDENILSIYEEMLKNAMIDYYVEVTKAVASKEDFMKLDLEEKKQILMDILDLNELYVSYSEIEDKNHNFSEVDKKLNKIFYEGI